MSKRTHNNGYIFISYLNSFHYLTNDGDCLLSLSESAPHNSTFHRVQLARTAALLYIFAFEGFLNRAIGDFLNAEDRDEAMENETRMSILDKLDFLIENCPLSRGSLNKSRYPWSHLKELVSLRNDFVHPKYDRLSVLEAFKGRTFVNLLPNRIPKGLLYKDRKGNSKKVERKTVIYSQSGLPKDPYSFSVEDAKKVRRILIDNLKEVNRLLVGHITDKWLHNDTFKLIHPIGGKVSDPLPDFPDELIKRSPQGRR